MAWDICKACTWDLDQPGLGEAIAGEVLCPNCGDDRPLTNEERLEIGQNFEHRLQMIEAALFPIN